MRDVALKRLVVCVSLVAAATTAAMSATAPAPKPAPKTGQPATKAVAKAAPRCKVAPADEYFGKLKMSILGIRNTIKDQGLKVDYEPDKAAVTFNAIALTEDAIRDWQHKYPCDSWLPGTVYSLEHFWTKIHTEDGVKHVHATYAWLRHDWSKHKIVVVARREDGAATIAPPVASAGAPAPAAAPTGSGGTSGAASTASQTQAGGMPMQSQATPVPGLAPQSVINAQNASPAPHH
jgi:hypothetical protein